MIKLYDQVPSIYSNASRDFQYLSWLVDIVLNSVKHNVDNIYNLPNTKTDPRLTELLAMTLGFKIKRNYDQKQLAALVSIIPSILKYKGTKKAITLAGEALITAANSVGTFSCEIVDNVLEVMLPEELVDTTLFMDLLPYILPAGITCKVVRRTELRPVIEPIDFNYSDTLYAEWYKDLSWDSEAQTSTGLSGLFNNTEPFFVNYKKSSNDSDELILNTGLLDNTVIPVLDPNEVLTDLKTNPRNEDT